MLTQTEMIKIFKNKSWNKLNKVDKKQFMCFMFGEEFINDKNKHKKWRG